MWLVDAPGCQLATLLLRRSPTVRWDVYRVSARYRDVNQHRTMLFGLPLGEPADPAGMVYGDAIGLVLHANRTGPQRCEPPTTI